MSQKPGDGDFVLRLIQDRLGDGAAGLGKGIYGPVRGHQAGLEVHFRGAAVVTGQKCQQYFTQPAPRFQVEPSHDPEIDGADGAVLHDEQVARMDVGMEKTVAEDLFKGRVGGLFQHRYGVVSGLDDGVAFIQ